MDAGKEISSEMIRGVLLGQDERKSMILGIIPGL